MSGSPVFIDGKLVGAVAYGFPFSKETIAGITPIAEMIEATRLATPRAASARLRPGWARGTAAPGGPLEAASRRPLRGPLRRCWRRRAAPCAAAPTPSGLAPSAGWRRWPLPLVFPASTPAARLRVGPRGLRRAWASRPSMGTGARAGLPEAAARPRARRPGRRLPHRGRPGPLGHRHHHPHRRRPRLRLRPSLLQPGAHAVPHEEGLRVFGLPEPLPVLEDRHRRRRVGTIEQDRTTAIAGRIGATPRMIPVQVKRWAPAAARRRFAFRIVEDELFSPVLAYVSLLSVLQANERAFGTSTVRARRAASCSAAGARCASRTSSRRAARRCRRRRWWPRPSPTS